MEKEFGTWKLENYHGHSLHSLTPLSIYNSKWKYKFFFYVFEPFLFMFIVRYLRALFPLKKESADAMVLFVLTFFFP